MKDNQVVKVKYVTVITYRMRDHDEVHVDEFDGMTVPAMRLIDILRNHVDDKGRLVKRGMADFFHISTAIKHDDMFPWFTN